MNLLRRIIHPETRVLDERRGLVEYVASDESVDSYQEIIRASGWRFTHFRKNAPFVDSHNYGSIDRVLGRVVEFKVTGRRLIETVQWAVEATENKLAQIGWQLTVGGFLKAVSVGFWPVHSVTPDGDPAEWSRQLRDLKLPLDARVSRIYLEQEQVELSAVVLGANPNALAKAQAEGVLDMGSLDFIRQRGGRGPGAHPTPTHFPAAGSALVADIKARARALPDEPSPQTTPEPRPIHEILLSIPG
jgi:hypothetical protein